MREAGSLTRKPMVTSNLVDRRYNGFFLTRSVRRIVMTPAAPPFLTPTTPVSDSKRLASAPCTQQASPDEYSAWCGVEKPHTPKVRECSASGICLTALLIAWWQVDCTCIKLDASSFIRKPITPCLPPLAMAFAFRVVSYRSKINPATEYKYVHWGVLQAKRTCRRNTSRTTCFKLAFKHSGT